MLMAGIQLRMIGIGDKKKDAGKASFLTGSKFCLPSHVAASQECDQSGNAQ